MTANPSSARDWLIIAAVLIIVTTGYFLWKSPAPAVPPSTSAAASAPAGHQDMGSADMASAMGMLKDLPTTYDSLVATGNAFMDEGNFPVAAECYRRALAVRDNPDVRVDFGACLHGMGLGDRAIEEFHRVLYTDNDHPIANFNIGVVYYNENQKDSARVYLQNYLALEPNGRASDAARDLIRELGG